MNKRCKKFMINILSLAIIISTFLLLYTNKNKESEINYIESSYIVQKGDTLWRIARDNVPGEEDKRIYIHEIKELNNLESSNLHIGQKLIILTQEER